MAKLNGPLGSKLRGKVGEVVAAKTVGGVTAIRAYQPVVKNPNTLRQQVARKKFAALSGLVASLSDVLNIGYAKANAGSKMYVRNMVMRDLSGAADIVNFVGGTINDINWPSFPFSKKVGLDGVPVVTYTAPVGAQSGKFSVTNADSIAINEAEEELGVVLVALTTTTTGILGQPIILTGKASAGVDVTAAQASLLGGCTIFAFFKAMPITGTDIPTAQWPWKYPSNTGASSQVLTMD